MDYHEPALIDLVTALRAGSLRYPGGTVGNYWSLVNSTYGLPCSHPATKTGPLLGGASGGGPAGLPAAFAAETLACLDSSRAALRNALVVLAAGRADLALVLLNADVALLNADVAAAGTYFTRAE